MLIVAVEWYSSCVMNHLQTLCLTCIAYTYMRTTLVKLWSNANLVSRKGLRGFDEEISILDTY